MRRPIAITLIISSALVASAGLEQLTSREALDGLREALSQGSTRAVAKLGKADGFFGNKRVRIPLPETLEKARKVLDTLGLQQQTQDLELAMNRAAEAAVPEAKTLLVDAVKSMSVQDAKQILTGGDTSATDYFRKATRKPLAQKFLPIVRTATAKVGLAAKYNAIGGKATELGLIGKEQANIDEYVTQKALDGLFLMISDEEKKIRRDPVGQTSKLLQKVFGAVGK